MSVEQFTFEFVAPNRYPSACLITIYRKSNIVVATDTDTGMSRSADAVTNACATIANEVAKLYRINPQRMIFIEQYRPGKVDQTTDLVKFDFVDGKELRHPRWIYMAPEEFEQIVSIAQDIELI